MFKVILGLITALVVSSSAFAETLTTTTDTQTGEVYIHFEGAYTQGTAQRFYDLVQETNAKYVTFNSSGGVSREGDSVAWIMGAYDLVAIVHEGNMCMSACAKSVLGANVRFINGVIGFHPAYLPEGSGGNPSESFKGGQIEGMNDTLFMIERGVSRQVIRAIQYFGSPDVFMVFTSTEDFNKIFSGEFTAEELISRFWTNREISIYIYMTSNGANLND